MDNWHPDDVYRLATERHNEDIARGEAARRARSATAGGPARARLATALVALAARLDPSRRGPLDAARAAGRVAVSR